MRLVPGLLLMICVHAQAEVFKCSDGPSITYQAIPCPKGEREKSLDIVLHDSEGSARARELLSAIGAEDQAMKEQDAREQKEKMDLLRKQLEIQNLAARLHNMQNPMNTPPPARPVLPPIYYGPVRGPVYAPPRPEPHGPAMNQHPERPEPKFGFGPRR